MWEGSAESSLLTYSWIKTYGNSSKESLHIRCLLLQEVIQELHKGLFSLEPREVGQGLQRLCNQRQVTCGALVRVL